MNRCSHSMKQLRAGALAALAVVCVLATVAWPQQSTAQEMRVRQFPPAAKRAMLTVVAPPEVTINGSADRMAPGVRIRNANNMLVVPTALVGQTVAVNYVREGQSGMLREIWILNPAELEQQRSGMETITNFIFGSDADKPKVDDGKTPYNQLPGYPKP